MRVIQGALFFLSIGALAFAQRAGHLFTSLHHVEHLFKFDQLVGSTVALLDHQGPATKKYLDLYSSLLSDSASKDGGLWHPEVSGNPLHIYTLFKRLVLYWPAVEKQFMIILKTENELHPIRQKIEDVLQVKALTVLPEEGDLRGAAQGIVRLQRFYNLPLDKLTRGHFYSIHCSARLMASDCMIMAKLSVEEKYFAGAWLWYKEAQRLTEDMEQHFYIKNELRSLKNLHDSDWVDNDSRFFPLRLSQKLDQIPWDEEYYQLCRGWQLLDPAKGASLKCYISSRGSPYLILQPLKVEELLHDPNISLIYDVINNNEIEELKQLATDKLLKSTIMSKLALETYRISQTAWLSEMEYDVVKRLSVRVSYITGLHTYEGHGDKLAGEPLQILSYEIGGHYATHYDTLSKYDEEKVLKSNISHVALSNAGDRLATLMFYLSDVDLGGRTVFPIAKVSVPPVKGAAVLWYNIRKNGEGHVLTKHAGCPVLLGQKWGANK